MFYGNVNQSYFRVERPKMFLMFLECKGFLKISHFAYVIDFASNFVALRYFLY